MKVLFVLALIIAIVYGQISNLDPFDTTSNKLEVAGNSGATLFESSTEAGVIGTERDIILIGTGDGTSSNCESETFVENGSWFANNGQTCRAKAILQYDGVDGSANRSFGLNLNLNDFGAAFLVDIQTDLTSSFTIRVFGSSEGSVSTVTQTIQSSSSLITHVFPFGSFSGNADFNNVGCIELEIDDVINTDVIVTLFDVISNEISGRVFSDCNCNGNFDSTDDLGVAGITVTGTPGGNCAQGTNTATASTNVDGSYILTGLAACTYTVSISNSNTVCNNANSVSSDATNDPTNVNFGLEQAGSFSVPSDTTIVCTQLVNGSPPTSITGTATSTGSCGGAGGTVQFSDSQISQECDGSFVVSRRWFSGGEEGFQVITVTDSNVGPSINVPASTTVPCGQSTGVGSTGDATATDDCSTNVSVNNVDSESVQCNADTCSPTTTIVRTFTAVDDCGNTSTGVQTITQSCNAGTPTDCPDIGTPPNDDGEDDDCYAVPEDDDLCICPVGDDDDDDFGSCQQSSSSSGASVITASFGLIALVYFLF